MAKHSFRENAFEDLRAVAGEPSGEPLKVRLSEVDEDPGQPRTNFDSDELAALAESIRIVGVLQPIGVRPQSEGRYRLVFGARRLRAAAQAGLEDIPAIVVGEEQSGLAAQVIENQARASLSNSDLAAVVERLHSEGKTLKEIAAICSLPEYQVSSFRSVPKLPPFLRERLDRADIRAIYDLYRTWQKSPAEVEAAMPNGEGHLSITEARRVIEGVTRRTTHSIAIDRARAEPTEPEPEGEAAPEPPSPAPQPTKPAKAPAKTPVFVVEAEDGRRGQLILDRKPSKPSLALVNFPGGEDQVPCASLKLVAVR